jgi:hypothetical protein
MVRRRHCARAVHGRWRPAVAMAGYDEWAPTLGTEVRPFYHAVAVSRTVRSTERPPLGRDYADPPVEDSDTADGAARAVSPTVFYRRTSGAIASVPVRSRPVSPARSSGSSECAGYATPAMEGRSRAASPAPFGSARHGSPAPTGGPSPAPPMAVLGPPQALPALPVMAAMPTADQSLRGILRRRSSGSLANIWQGALRITRLGSAGSLTEDPEEAGPVPPPPPTGPTYSGSMFVVFQRDRIYGPRCRTRLEPTTADGSRRSPSCRGPSPPPSDTGPVAPPPTVNVPLYWVPGWRAARAEAWAGLMYRNMHPISNTEFILRALGAAGEPWASYVLSTVPAAQRTPAWFYGEIDRMNTAHQQHALGLYELACPAQGEGFTGADHDSDAALPDALSLRCPYQARHHRREVNRGVAPGEVEGLHCQYCDVMVRLQAGLNKIEATTVMTAPGAEYFACHGCLAVVREKAAAIRAKYADDANTLVQGLIEAELERQPWGEVRCVLCAEYPMTGAGSAGRTGV